MADGCEPPKDQVEPGSLVITCRHIDTAELYVGWIIAPESALSLSHSLMNGWQQQQRRLGPYQAM